MNYIDNTLIWISLNCLPKFSDTTGQQFWQKYHNPENIWNSFEIQSLPNAILVSAKNQAQKIFADCEHFKITVLHRNHTQLPRNLQLSPYMGNLLFLEGKLPPLNEYLLGVVGTRRPDQAGVRACKYILNQIPENLTIVSGLASGIDFISHKQALRQNKKTIAVLGQGSLQKLSLEKQNLKEEILENGAILSQFLPHVPASKYTFPKRNQIISGLSHSLLVGQCPIPSGALITSRLALDEGKEVFCIPGEVTNSLNFGQNQLFEDGAKALISPKSLYSLTSQKAPKIKKNTLSKTQRDLLKFMKCGSHTLHQLSQKLDKPIGETIANTKKLEHLQLLYKNDRGEYCTFPV